MTNQARNKLKRIFRFYIAIMATSELSSLAIENSVNIYKINPDCYVILCALLPFSMCACWMAGVAFGNLAAKMPQQQSSATMD
jgi:hypothetical protein